MKFFDSFKSNKGSWIMTGILIILLMGIASYPDFWTQNSPNQTDNSLNSQMAGDNQGVPVINVDDSTVGSEDGQALPTDPDTTIADTTVNAAPTSWVYPLLGETGRAYGFNHDPTYEDYRFHHGVDIMAEPGTAVYASAGGRVIISRDDSSWGGVVTIEHGGGWQTIYRCLEPQVAYGEEIEAGEAIGYIVEKATVEAGEEAHLHFEMYLDGQEVDPAIWL